MATQGLSNIIPWKNVWEKKCLCALNKNYYEKVRAAPSGMLLWLQVSSTAPFVVLESPQTDCSAPLSLCSSWRPTALYGELENGKAANHAWCNLHLIDEGLRITETINLYQDSCGPKRKRLCHQYPILIFALINHMPFHIYFVFRINFCSHRC